MLLNCIWHKHCITNVPAFTHTHGCTHTIVSIICEHACQHSIQFDSRVWVSGFPNYQVTAASISPPKMWQTHTPFFPCELMYDRRSRYTSHALLHKHHAKKKKVCLWQSVWMWVIRRLVEPHFGTSFAKTFHNLLFASSSPISSVSQITVSWPVSCIVSYRAVKAFNLSSAAA